MSAEEIDWRRALYAAYVSSGQGGIDAAVGYRHQAPYLRRLVARHVPKNRNARILDLGCGAGGLLFVLNEAGYSNVLGVDFSSEMVEAARRNGIDNIKIADLHDEIREANDQSVDVVFVMDVLEHLELAVTYQLCRQIARVLTPGGRVIAHVPNAEGIFGSRVRYGDLTHEVAFTQQSMRQLLQATGFQQVRCYEDRPVLRGIKGLIRAVTWSMGTLAFRALFVAETGQLNCILSQNLLVIGEVP